MPEEAKTKAAEKKKRTRGTREQEVSEGTRRGLKWHA